MTEFINYTLEATLGLLLLLVFYKTVLSRETNFNFLRYFLLVGIFLSVTLPMVHFQGNQSTSLSIGQALPAYWLPQVAVDNSKTSSLGIDLSLWGIVKWIYLLGVTVTLLKFIYRLLKLTYLIITVTSHQFENFRIVESNQYPGNFSFFNFIFIGKEDAISETEKRQIIEHEKIHIQELHSIDVLLLNLLAIGFWFNPFIRTYKKIFVQLHEFEADARAVKNHDANMYCSLLARVALQSAGFSLANHFNNSLTLKRITMIRTIKKKITTWKLSLASILFPCMFFLLACQDQVFPQQPSVKPAQVSNSDAVYLVVDEPPTYPGNLGEFVSQNMKYPEKAMNDKTEGTVFVVFIVEKNGTVSEATVIKGVNKECDEEALRVVKLLNPWNPGKQSGKPVRVKFVLPVKFKQ